MKVNWTVRFKHKPFLVATFALFLILIQQVAELFGVDTTVYSDQATKIFNTILAILVGFGVISDPTTEGVSDSKQAMRYIKPKEDK